MGLLFNRPIKIFFKRDESLPGGHFCGMNAALPVPELTRSADIKLNPRVSLRGGPSRR
jgi:hypothetical protein